MIEITGDIREYFDKPKTAICITTNGALNKHGYCVMGAGTAKIARDAFPACDMHLGILICEYGNMVQTFHDDPILVAFPTKHHFKDETSDIELIRKSARQLAIWAQYHPDVEQIILPKPGGQNGKLDYNLVREVIAPILTADKFKVIGLE